MRFQIETYMWTEGTRTDELGRGIFTERSQETKWSRRKVSGRRETIKPMQAGQEKEEWSRGMEIPKISQHGTQIYHGPHPRLSAQRSLAGRQEEAEENVSQTRQNRRQWLHPLLAGWPQTSNLKLPKLHVLIFKMETIMMTYQGWGDVCNESGTLPNAMWVLSHNIIQFSNFWRQNIWVTAKAKLDYKHA